MPWSSRRATGRATMRWERSGATSLGIEQRHRRFCDHVFNEYVRGSSRDGFMQSAQRARTTYAQSQIMSVTCACVNPSPAGYRRRPRLQIKVAHNLQASPPPHEQLINLRPFVHCSCACACARPTVGARPIGLLPRPTWHCMHETGTPPNPMQPSSASSGPPSNGLPGAGSSFVVRIITYAA